ncbi:MAG TPA: thioredoxin domain-containing protein [Terriglobia bacterium]|nr:thioredoxin domain-containing protein [Terriglobia bacterium]
MRKAVLLALSLVGLFDSVYLWWVYTSASRTLVCIGGGCDVVRASPFAHAWGVPLPAFGAVMYAALVVLLFAQPLVSAAREHSLRLAVAVISGAGFLTSLYLTSIEAFVLHAWCAWCVVSAIAVTLILLLSILEAARPAPPAEPGVAPPAPLRLNVALLVIAVALGAPAFYWLSHHGELPPLQQASREAINARLVRADSHTIGNPDAPVTVVEFGDFECPVCGAEEPTVRELRQRYANRIRFVFRQFPIMSLHPQAEKAAEASECAAEQGKFWEAVEKLYAEQSDLSEPALMRDAADLGLDQARFGQCLKSGAEAERVRRDLEDGHALHVDRTPTFFVNGQMAAGEIPLEQFAQLIDGALKAHEAVAQSTTAGAKPVAHPGSSSTPSGDSPLLGGATSAFSQIAAQGIGCSEAEARQKQPATIHSEEARRLQADPARAVFVDVREPIDFQTARIPGAINIPLAEMPQHWSSLPQNKTIVFYEGGRAGSGDVCAASRSAGRILLEHGFGFEHVKVYQEGLLGWEKAGLPVSR